MPKRNKLPVKHAPLAWLTLLLLNAQGVNTHLPQIQTSINALKNQPKIIGITETHHKPGTISNKPFLPGFQWLGKPSTEQSRGVGFWIENKLSLMCEVIPKGVLGREHPDIQWIHMTAEKTTVYIAIVYSHPNDVQNNKRILDSLEHNLGQLRNKGRIVIMGDFNARCPSITGDKIGSSNSHAPKMLDFITTCELTPLGNKAQQSRNDHFTFQGPNGVSIPDYVLVPDEQLGSYKYEVNNRQHTGSFHRMVEVQVYFPECIMDSWR
jgi:hypothetical protein